MNLDIWFSPDPMHYSNLIHIYTYTDEATDYVDRKEREFHDHLKVIDIKFHDSSDYSDDQYDDIILDPKRYNYLRRGRDGKYRLVLYHPDRGWFIGKNYLMYPCCTKENNIEIACEITDKIKEAYNNGDIVFFDPTVSDGIVKFEEEKL